MMTKMKKISAVFLALLLVFFLSSCNASVTQNGTTQASDASVTADAANAAFSDGDNKDVTGETPNAEITLSGAEGTISDTTRGSSGSVVTVTSKGIYRVTGSAENVTIEINDANKSGNVYLVLDGVTITNNTSPCILVSNADKVIIETVGSNSLTNANTDQNASADGAIYSEDDLTLFGTGSLNVTSSLHGVVCENDLKITGGTLGIDAGLIGLKSGDSVRVGGGSIIIKAQHDGIQVKNDEKSGYFLIENGVLTVNAGYDGISADAGFSAAEGTLTITAGGGSENVKNDSVSQKGIKCNDLAVAGGFINVSSPDDAVNCKYFAIAGGNLTLSSSDDGIHADSAIAVSGGEICVAKSYEGFEAETIAIAGGNIRIYASDDGVNAAGGSDTSSQEKTPWQSGDSSTGSFSVSGGNLYVNADGDGLDTNGSFTVSGGTVIVEGPTDNGNGALDKGDGASCTAQITGGTVLALGSEGMAINFDSGSQCSALVRLSGGEGTTITVDDGSGFTFTTSKSFSTVVYSSPDLAKGKTYTITAGGVGASIDFSKGLYYSDVPAMR
ncbi:MAG: carbohydrate-binding domain-containing protein [Clostridia bacterium]|nr:carbohydrate-binding domain-containing protein [Clostridia bacterium]